MVICAIEASPLVGTREIDRLPGASAAVLLVAGHSCQLSQVGLKCYNSEATSPHD